MRVTVLALAMLGFAVGHAGAAEGERQRALQGLGLLVGSAEGCDYEIDQDRYDAFLQRRLLSSQDMSYLDSAIRRAADAMVQFEGEELAEQCAAAEQATKQLGIVKDE